MCTYDKKEISFYFANTTTTSVCKLYTSKYSPSKKGINGHCIVNIYKVTSIITLSSAAPEGLHLLGDGLH